MTNDELNRWYHEYLGKCVHDVKKVQFYNPPLEFDDIKYICRKCEVSFNTKDEAETPDYLSDPAVILGIIKEHKIKVEPNTQIAQMPKYVAEIRHRKSFIRKWDDELERAVMLALKAKVENES